MLRYVTCDNCEKLIGYALEALPSQPMCCPACRPAVEKERAQKEQVMAEYEKKLRELR